MDIRKNDIVKIKIEDIGTDGEGIGRYEGYTLFVKDAVVGDEILAKVIKMKKNYGYGRLMEIRKPSPYRVKPKDVYKRQLIGRFCYPGQRKIDFPGEKSDKKKNEK